jgi:hypothetical protein
MFTATAAKLLEFQTLRRRLLILRRHIIATFAVRALKHNIITRHNLPSKPVRNLIFYSLSAISFQQSAGVVLSGSKLTADR